MAKIPNQDLINLRNTFGVDPEFLFFNYFLYDPI